MKADEPDYVYMAVTKDEYELPIAVADSGPELSRMLGLKDNTVTQQIWHCAKRGWRCQYKKIYIGDERSDICGS